MKLKYVFDLKMLEKKVNLGVYKNNCFYYIWIWYIRVSRSKFFNNILEILIVKDF